MHSIETFQFPLTADSRGNLVPIEFMYLPFSPRRVYYLTSTKEKRGGHAHRDEEEIFVCVNGSFEARMHDGKVWHTFKLKGPCDAVYNNKMIWHEFDNFSPDAIMLCLSSTSYNPERKGYIMDFETFTRIFSS